jgi:hypothetical protein
MTSLSKKLAKYPRFGKIERTLKGPSSNPCVVCKEPGWRYVSIEWNWFRGEDEVMLVCKNKDCLSSLKKDPYAYAPDIVDAK